MPPIELTAKEVIIRARQLLPNARDLSNARLGRALWTELRGQGGEKLRKDRYGADPKNVGAPKSGQRYRVPTSVIDRGLDRLARDMLARAVARRRTPRSGTA